MRAGKKKAEKELIVNKCLLSVYFVAGPTGHGDTHVSDRGCYFKCL